MGKKPNTPASNAAILAPEANLLVSFFKKQDQSPGDNETFVRLIQLAQEDSQIGDQLRALLSVDEFNRQSVIRSMLDEMRLDNAPAELISAFACLLDDRIADKAIKVLDAET
jgi:hypothetical protein